MAKLKLVDQWGNVHDVSLKMNIYGNRNLRIDIICHDDGYPEPWSTLTTNITSRLPENHAYIDINNNGKEIMPWLVENGLGVFSGDWKSSGFCDYPEFIFYLSEVKKYEM